MFATLQARYDEFVAWGRATAPWKFVLALAGLSFVALLSVPVLVAVLPIALLVVAVACLVLFAEVWLKEFRFLMELRDDAFPGQNDKLIWGILLIVLPPVGAWLFRAHRLVRWPEVKAATRVVGDVS